MSHSMANNAKNAYPIPNARVNAAKQTKYRNRNIHPGTPNPRYILHIHLLKAGDRFLPKSCGG